MGRNGARLLGVFFFWLFRGTGKLFVGNTRM